MIETKDTLEISKRRFFIKKFVPKLDEWKEKNKEHGGTDQAFAMLIGVGKNMIPQYKKGDAYPREETLKKIIKYLGVPEDYFTPTTLAEKWESSPEYMNEVGRTHATTFCEEIGLDLEFLSCMRRMIGDDFGKEFPFWTPIEQTPKRVLPRDWFNTYTHLDLSCLADSAEMSEPELAIFQSTATATKDGEEQEINITLSRPDLRFLRDVQEDVKTYIEFLFTKRKKELQNESKEACQRSWVTLTNGGKAFRPLNAEALNDIDKYFKEYVDEKPESE